MSTSPHVTNFLCSHERWRSKIGIMDMVLTAVYEQVPESEGDGYVAYVEELPGAISEGDTLEEARENLRDAVELLLEAHRDLAEKRISGKKITREKITVSVA